MSFQAPHEGSRRARPNLFTVPAGQPFLEVLADAVLHDRLDLSLGLGTPADLARLTIYLPTRRSARALASVLVRAGGRKALILPRLVPLGDPGEAELQDILAGPPPADPTLHALLPIDPLTRQLLLAIQIKRASTARDRMFPAGATAGGSLGASTLGSAFALAGDLAALLDAMQAENIGYQQLLGLDAARFDELWQLTARFLAIIGETWPLILAERGVCDPITWRNRLIDAQAARLIETDADAPVIVAGSTGSMPATARLIGTVARLRRGAVILPDLDLESDDADWMALVSPSGGANDRAASHPQAQLAHLLMTMSASRSEVRSLHVGVPDAPCAARRALAHEALRLSASTVAWRSIAQRLSPAMVTNAVSTLSVLEASDERGEALSIALLIRRALDTPSRTIALVTPDRGLAERVALELQRWGITVDDSAGRPLGRTPAGHMLRLLIDILRSGATTQDVLELLHHPLAHLGLPPAARSAARQALEIGALSGVRGFAGLDELRQAVANMPERIADIRAPRPRQRLVSSDIEAATDLVRRLETVLIPLLADSGNPDLSMRAAKLRDAMIAVSMNEHGDVTVFSGNDGEALRALLDDIETGFAGVEGTADDLLSICSNLMAERVVRSRGREHPRVMLLGPLEARLLSADLVILGGLNEGSWPPQTRTDAFLNRAMRAEIGLSSPERRIGQSAHDFIQAFAASEVVLARSAKVAGVQALPSRFWQRLKAIVPKPLWEQASARGAEWHRLASRIDRPAQLQPCGRPKPRPPASLQPIRFSVTEAETLYRDPYAIFAKRILQLAPLEPVGIPLGASDRGQLMHAVMERFAHAWPVELPPDPLASLMADARVVFAPLMSEPDVQAFWWPRFVLLAPEIIRWEVERRSSIRHVGSEMRIRHTVRLGDGTDILLTARADRIELMHDGKVNILDFKTGSIPTPKQVKAGLAPQLLLEAAIAPLSPFEPVDASAGRMALGPAAVTDALYLALKPGPDAMKKKSVVDQKADLTVVAAEHLDGFRHMVGGFRSGERSFTSRFAAQFVRFDGDFDHLARVKEWSAAGNDSDEEMS